MPRTKLIEVIANSDLGEEHANEYTWTEKSVNALADELLDKFNITEK